MVINFTPTGHWLFKKPPQYVAETTYNTPPASSTFKLVGDPTGTTPVASITKEIVRVLGNRDPVSQPKQTEAYSLTIKYRPFTSTKLDFAKYGINLANETTPAGTNAESVAVAWSVPIDNVEKYFIATGCKTNTVEIEVSKDGGVVVSQELICKQIRQHLTDLTSAGITTPTYITTYPVEDPWASFDGGATPFSIEATEWKVDRFKITVNQNLASVAPNGTQSIEYLAATEREATFEFDTWLKSSVILDYLMAGTRLDMIYTLKTGLTPPVTITITDGVLSDRQTTFEGGNREFTRENATGDCMSVILAG